VIIGSNCFTGCHIADAVLNAGQHEVIGISRSPEYKPLYLPYRTNPAQSHFRFVQLDLVRDLDRVRQLLDTEKPPVVINVAAYSEVALSNERPVEYFETNTLGTVQLCNFLRTKNWLKQYVHISSAEVYGSCPYAVTEDHLFNPSTPYAVSKAAADMYLYTIMKNFGFPATLIRSTNVYGRHQQLFKIVPRAAIYLNMGRTIELHGGGTSMKSFIHVRDVVDGLMLTIQKQKTGTWHFSVPAERTIADVVKLVCEKMGHDFGKASRVVGERLGQDSRYWLDCTKSQTELGWSPQISFEDGVQETIDWVNANWAQIQNEPLNYIHKAA
jgi:dTDP-glucose 4,6-dehydratase